MQLFDFRCTTCDHVFEEWDTIDRTTKPACPECQAPEAIRKISAPRLDYTQMIASGVATSDGMTTAIDKWTKKREAKMKIEKRNLERHGTYD